MKDRFNKSLNNPVHTAIASSVVSLAVGFAAGYIWRKRRFYVIKAEAPQPELDFTGVETVNDLPTGDNRRPPKVIITPEHPVFTAPEDGVYAIETHIPDDDDTVITIEPVGPEFDEPDIVTHNVFAGNDIDWDYDEELKNRTDTEPYVLHKDEFFENESDYVQSTFTYYEGDDILTDADDDSIIYNVHDIIGEYKFGHGSGDPKVFYVRNDKRHAEYEIIKDPGHYAVEVLGNEIEANARVDELRHSRVPKFRMD